jgi:putative transposase
MEVFQRKWSHTVSRLTCQIVWSTKYRYKVLEGDLQLRCREFLPFPEKK